MIHKIYQWTLTNSHCLDCQRDLGNNTLTRLICEIATLSLGPEVVDPKGVFIVNFAFVKLCYAVTVLLLCCRKYLVNQFHCKKVKL